MSFEGGFAAFTEGFLRSREASENRRRLEAQDKRTEQAFASQLEEQAFQKRQRNKIEAVETAEMEARTELTKPPKVEAPPVVVEPAPTEATPVNQAVTDPRDAKVAAVKSQDPLDYAPKFSGLPGAGVSKFSEFSPYAREMQVATRLRSMPGGEKRAMEIEARAKDMRREGVMDTLASLDSGDAQGALDAFNRVGSARLPEGAKFVPTEVGPDLITGSKKQKYALVGSDGKTIVPDVHAAAYAHALGLGDRLNLEINRSKVALTEENMKAQQDIGRARLELAREKLETGAGKPLKMDEDDKIRLRDANSRVADAEKAVVEATKGLQPGDDKEKFPGYIQAKAALQGAKMGQFRTMYELGQITNDRLVSDTLGSAKNTSDVMRSLNELRTVIGTDATDDIAATITNSDTFKSMAAQEKGAKPAAAAAKPVDQRVEKPSGKPGYQPTPAAQPQADSGGKQVPDWIEKSPARKTIELAQQISGPNSLNWVSRMTYQQGEIRDAAAKKGWIPYVEKYGATGQPAYRKPDGDGGWVTITAGDLAKQLGIEY